ncbi:MAG: sugar phosphate isomerase/epimerase family protein [Alkalilacustris sp.]
MLPILGAALGVRDLPRWGDWLRAADRCVELHDFIAPALLEGDWRGVAEQAGALLHGHAGPRGLHGPFLDFGVAAGDPAIVAIARRRLDRGLDVAAVLGATQMVVHSPFTRWLHLGHAAGLVDPADVAARAADLLAPALARAADQGVTLVLENIEDPDPAARALIVQAAASPALALSVDTGHAAVAHGTSGAPPPEVFVQAAGAALAHVHVADNDLRGDLHLPPGAGAIDWRAVFAALPEDPPRLLLELKDPDRLPEAVAYLEGLGLAA